MASQFDRIMRMGINDFGTCPRCKATVGSPCRTPKGDEAREPHQARVDAYWRAAADAKSADDAAAKGL